LSFEFKNVLLGTRIELIENSATEAFAKTMYSTIDHNRNFLKPWFPWINHTNCWEDSLKYLSDCIHKKQEKNFIEYGIYINTIYVGNISIFDINHLKKSGEIGYWISEEYTNQGYVTEAVGILEKEFFESYHYNRIQIQCDVLNHASKKVALNCNFIMEGILRENQYNEFDNSFRSTVILSKLKSAYFA
jgi:ribosomal-protein-serine acetyltransferase